MVFHASGVVVALLASSALLCSGLPPELRFVGALALFVGLPGWLAVELAFGQAGPRRLERGLLGLGCGYVLAALLALVLYAGFRPLGVGHLVGGASVLNAVLLAAWVISRFVGAHFMASSSGAGGSRDSRRLPGQGAMNCAPTGGRVGVWSAVLVVLLVLVVAAPLRLWNLGYSEFQGDEAKVVLRAMAVLQGVPDALIAHRKPPGEILLGALFGGGLGVVTELLGRLPFALAGVAGVLAIFALGRAMFGSGAGLVAGLLLAVNGYWVAFGRIMQYQSVGLLLDTLAVLCLYRFTRDGDGSRRGYAVLGGLLLAGAGLMALSAVFLVPVAAVALGPCVFGRRRRPRRELAIWLWPLVLLAPLGVAVYGPLAQGSGDALDLASAWPYLGPRLGEGRPYFNLGLFLTSASLYTSSLYTVVALGAGVVVVLGLGWRAAAGGWRRAAGGVGEWAPTALACVWLVGPLVTHLFLIRIPGTHWREVFPGLVLLLGAAAAGLFGRRFGDAGAGEPGTGRINSALGGGVTDHRLKSVAWWADGVTGHRRKSVAWWTDRVTDHRRKSVAWGGRLFVALAGLFLVACGHFVYVAWIRPWPEYQLNYPLYRHPLDWSGRTARDPGGTFGDVRHAGWKTVGVLVADGRLPDEYATNDARQAEAAWYLKWGQGCPETAGLYIRLPLTPRERRSIEREEAVAGWASFGRVLSGEHPTLALFTREPPPGGPRDYFDADFAGRFDRELASPWVPVGQLYRPEVDFRRVC